MAHEWLTYEELGTLSGSTANAARVLAQRRKWRREIGNDGRTRVLVDTDALRIGAARFKPGKCALQNAADVRPSDAPDARDEHHKAELERLVASHRETVQLLIERVDAAELRAERMEELLREVLAHQRRPWWRRWFG